MNLLLTPRKCSEQRELNNSYATSLRSEAQKHTVLVVSTQNPPVIQRIKESYRQQAYVAVITLDRSTKSWGWKGHVDFDVGIHSISTTRTFATAEQAMEHMRQSAHQCIDNRLG